MLITLIYAMLVLGGLCERIGLLRFDKPALKGASPVPTFHVLVCLVSVSISNKTTKTMSTFWHIRHTTETNANRNLLSAVIDIVFQLCSRSKPHISAPAKNPPTTTSLKAPMSARKCNFDHLLAVYDRAASVACTYLRCI